MESGDDYHVEIGCQRPSGSKLRFEVHRFFPPVEELTKIRSVQVMLEQGQEATFSETIDVTLSDERDVKVVGEVNFSPDDIETLVKASRMTISDNATGKILFRSQMQGILGGRDLLRERCGI